MKKGISFWAYEGKTYREAFAFAKALGFDGVEITLDPEGEITMETPDEEILAIKRQAQEVGLKLYSVATGLFWHYALTAEDPSVREKAMSVARREIEIAALMGCDTVLIVPAMVNEETPYDVAYDRALSAIRVLAPFAAEKKVKIGVENVWNNFMLSPLEMRDFVDAVGSPWVGAYFDVGNVVYEGWPEHWISVLGQRIVKVHFKDFIRKNRTLGGFVPIGEGDVNYAKVMAALRAVGYDDFCTAEVAPEGEDGLEGVAKAAKAYDRIFKEDIL